MMTRAAVRGQEDVADQRFSVRACSVGRHTIRKTMGLFTL
eukprot:CAMPEP_0185185464 /NCGR_PEP_ID=MMETSP1140-20130426/3325_1 /TAXON_ID=298111 /ORGANISM="Pavlova sp., Strain CCMP459" /LENGTH=39 /DNA_ID= /DNA_START= /DNA_END= /DNA_ORIENTATION=